MSTDAGLIKGRMAGWHILVVEDDEDAILITSRWFRLAGATLTSAQDGAVALSLARSTQPTLIISDLHMPVMDGWHLCEALKADSSTRNIPVVALSADYSSETRQRAREVGFSGYIRKPLDPTKFLDVLVEVIQSIPSLAEKWEASKTD